MKVVFYGEVINKYVENGVVEEVFCDEIILIDGCFVFYFFYYVIIREDKQIIKIRVVFDVLVRDSNGVFLNSCLELGLVLQLDLVGIFLCF